MATLGGAVAPVDFDSWVYALVAAMRLATWIW
jgi:hypothetical protein